MKEFIQTAGFAAILTAFVTIATCVITEFHGVRKFKIEKFNEIYDCLLKFSKQKSKVMKHCNDLIESAARRIPEDMGNRERPEDVLIYRQTYHDFHVFLREYSGYLELLLSFYHFLYKDKGNIPATKEECWTILELYAALTGIDYPGAEECQLEYVQIVTLIQFIKMNSGFFGRMRIYQYLKENRVFDKWRTRIARAFF